METIETTTFKTIAKNTKYCIKKIQEIDSYLGYIAYSEHNEIFRELNNLEELLKELITKYPNKPEAYLKYWDSLMTNYEYFSNNLTKATRIIYQLYNNNSLDLKDNYY